MFELNALLPDRTLALLQATPPLYPPDWYRRPEFYYPIGLSALCLLVLLLYRAPEIAAWYRARKGPTMTPKELEPLMFGAPPVIIDLRPPTDFHGPKGHLRGAHNVAYSQLVPKVAEVAKDRRMHVVLVDHNDVLSHKAAVILQAAGFQWVRVLRGGIRAWIAQDLPVVHSKSNP